MRHLTDKI